MPFDLCSDSHRTINTSIILLPYIINGFTVFQHMRIISDVLLSPTYYLNRYNFIEKQLKGKTVFHRVM